MGVGCQRHAPAALPPRKTRYTLYRRLGGSQGRSGQVREISPPPRFDPRAVHPVASRYTDYAIPALNCFSLLNTIKQKTWKRHGEACSTHGEDEKFIANLGIKACPLGRRGCQQEDIIKMDLKEIGRELGLSGSLITSGVSI
jgi:hypothetical protein